MVHAVVAGEIPGVRRRVDRRRSVALLGAAAGVAKLDRRVCPESVECFAMTSDFGRGPTPLGLPSDEPGAYLSSRFRHLMIAPARCGMLASSASRVQAREGHFLAPASPQ